MIYELNFDISFVSIYFRAGQRPTRARVEFRIKPAKPKSAHMQCERAAAFWCNTDSTISRVRC